MAANDDGGVGMCEKLRTREQVVGRSCQRVEVCATVNLFAHQLFWSSVGDGADSHVGCSDTAAVIEWSRDSKICQKDVLLIGSQIRDDDVGGFDITMQQALLVRVIQCTSDGAGYCNNKVGMHARWITLRQELVEIGSVDVIHRDPEMIPVLTTVVDPYNMRVA